MQEKILDQDYWSNRYKENQTGWDIGHCSSPLKAYFDQLRDKNIEILIPGAGFGHEAIYLHSIGFTNVHVIDLAAEPLVYIALKCPTFPRNHLNQGDFFKHEGTYDLIVEQTFFCALTPALRKDYVYKMKSLLAKDGKLIGVLFNRSFENGPPFGGTFETYYSLFQAHFKEINLATCYNSIPEREGSEVFIRISDGFH